MYMFTQNNKKNTHGHHEFCNNDHRYSLYGIRYIEALFKLSNSDLESNCLTVWWFTLKLETISSLCFVKLILEKNWPNQQS